MYEILHTPWDVGMCKGKEFATAFLIFVTVLTKQMITVCAPVRVS